MYVKSLKDFIYYVVQCTTVLETKSELFPS